MNRIELNNRKRPFTTPENYFEEFHRKLMDELPEDALLCPMIDARRMEVYAAIYDRALNAVKEVSALVDAVHAGKRHLDNSDIKRNGASVAQRAKRSE